MAVATMPVCAPMELAMDLAEESCPRRTMRSVPVWDALRAMASAKVSTGRRRSHPAMAAAMIPDWEVESQLPARCAEGVRHWTS